MLYVACVQDEIREYNVYVTARELGILEEKGYIASQNMGSRTVFITVARLGFYDEDAGSTARLTVNTALGKVNHWIEEPDAAHFWAACTRFERENGLIKDETITLPAIGSERTFFVESKVVRDYFVSFGSAHYHVIS